MIILISLLIFFSLQAFILFCCAAAANDPLSQELSDKEQLEYIRQWHALYEKKKDRLS